MQRTNAVDYIHSFISIHHLVSQFGLATKRSLGLFDCCATRKRKFNDRSA